jgi:Undecaprenyl-phosphate glucose phosphotransferase
MQVLRLMTMPTLSAAFFHDPTVLMRHGFVEYFRFAVRLKHALIATLPGLALGILEAGWENVIMTNHLSILLFLGLLTVLIFQVHDIYSERLFSNLLLFRTTLFAWGISFGIMVFIYKTLIPSHEPDARLLLSWFSISLLGLGVGRLLLLWLFRALRRRNLFLQRAVILGCTENGFYLARHLQQHGDIRVGIVGFIHESIDPPPERMIPVAQDIALPLLGNVDRLCHMIRRDEIHTVLVALSWTDEERISHILRQLRNFPVNVLLMPDILAFRYAHNRIHTIAGLPLFDILQVPLRGWSPLLKRIEDILLGSLCLVILLPLMLCIALAIKLDSPGPVLFQQRRYGYNNRLIKIYKFRSMYAAQNDPEGQVQASHNDDRVTRVGRFIRKASLDELPQLINVLFGDMSMVGPRPHATATKAAGILFENAVEEYTARHRVKPGITGWAQVNGYRGETNTLDKIQKRVEYDLEYIERWSLWFDLYILFRTLPAVISARSAY